jgi:hypothetical protein
LKSVPDGLKKPAAPITIPSAGLLGRIASHTWFEADDWMELNEAERDIWQIPELVCHSVGVVVAGVGSHLLTGVVLSP